MRCPECGGELVSDVREQRHCYRGQTTAIATRGDYCLRCGEAILAEGEWERIDLLVQDFHRQVNNPAPLSLVQLFRVPDAHPEMIPLLQKTSPQSAHA